jgi:hypothetical protein
VPDAWLVQYGVERMSALYYFANVDRVLFTRSLAQESRRVSAPDGSGLEAPAEAGIARLRGPEPAFCLTKETFAPELIARTGAVVVRRRLTTVLLANPAALATLVAQDEASPR